MRTLRWVVLLVVVLFVGAELALPALAESRIENRVRERLRGVAAVDADLGPFPVVSRLVATGSVPRLELTLAEVAGRELPFIDVRFALEGVVIDRAAAVGGQVDVTGIRRGVVTAGISLDELAGTLDASLVGDVLQEALQSAQLLGPRLVLPGVAQLAVPQDLIPCSAEATVAEGRLVLSCALEGVPGFLAPAT